MHKYANIFPMSTNVFHRQTHQEGKMQEKTKYFVLKKKAVPEVLLKVVEAKRLLESERAESVQEATDMVGISRSSFYSIKMTSFHFMTMPRERRLPW